MDQINFHEAGRICRVAIADSNLLFRKGIRTLLTSDMSTTVIGESGTRSELLEQLAAFAPEVLIVEAALLPDSTETTLVTEFRRATHGIKLLVLASADHQSYLEAAVACAARGYLLKSSAPAQLKAAIRKIAAGDASLNASAMIPDLLALEAQTPATAPTMLTSREVDVVRLLAAGKTVLTVASDLALSPKTIEAHKLNLMRKLDIHDRASLIAYANRTGLVAAA